MRAGFASCWPRLGDAWPLQALVLWGPRSSPLRLPQCVVRSLELILKAPPSLLLNQPAGPVPPASETNSEACLSVRCRAPPLSSHQRVLPGQHWGPQQASLPPKFQIPYLTALFPFKQLEFCHGHGLHTTLWRPPVQTSHSALHSPLALPLSSPSPSRPWLSLQGSGLTFPWPIPQAQCCLCVTNGVST